MIKMKDSGIAWIGDIPSDWNIVPNKRVMQKSKIICDKYNNENVLSLTMNGVTVRDLENPTGKMPLTFDGYQYVQAGNLLMCLFDIDVTPRCVGVINNDGVTSPAYSQFKLLNDNYVRYYYYYYLYLDFTKELLHLAKNLRHSLTESQLGEIYVPVPPLETQHHIADYLDKKCAKIDAIIEKQQTVIEKLKEYKLSVITEAVIKGLNPNVEMKDSGDTKIGNIPKHWNLRKLKNFITLISKGTTPSTLGGEILSKGNVRFFKAENIQNNQISMFPEHYIDNETNELLKRSKLQTNDILFVIAGATIGKTAIVSEDLLPANTNQAVSFIRLQDTTQSRFVWYYLQSHYVRDILNILSVQSAQPNLSMEDMKNFSLCIPPKNEIMQITKYLDKKCNDLEKIICSKQEIINKLVEYKKSLIYEVVTGKKEV